MNGFIIASLKKSGSRGPAEKNKGPGLDLTSLMIVPEIGPKFNLMSLFFF